MADVADGKITEAFGSGTAAVPNPRSVNSATKSRISASAAAESEPLPKLYDTLTGIRGVHLPDRFDWVKKL